MPRQQKEVLISRRCCSSRRREQGKDVSVYGVPAYSTLGLLPSIVAGDAWGRVRAMIDDHGQPVNEAGPATPVEVLGLQEAQLGGIGPATPPNNMTCP